MLLSCFFYFSSTFWHLLDQLQNPKQTLDKSHSSNPTIELFYTLLKEDSFDIQQLDFTSMEQILKTARKQLKRELLKSEILCLVEDQLFLNSLFCPQPESYNDSGVFVNHHYFDKSS